MNGIVPKNRGVSGDSTAAGIVVILSQLKGLTQFMFAVDNLSCSHGHFMPVLQLQR